jgi:hypothetical protein
MITYKYIDKQTGINLRAIHEDIGTSGMTDKSISWCRWDEDEALLSVYFDNDLSAEDKEKLDIIVENNV